MRSDRGVPRVDDIAELKAALVDLIHAATPVLGTQDEDTLDTLQHEIKRAKAVVRNTKLRQERRAMGQQAQD